MRRLLPSMRAMLILTACALIAALGTGNTMLMNIAERRRELSILWAGGMSRRQLQAMAVAEPKCGRGAC